MDELPGAVTQRRVSFKTQNHLPTYMNGKKESMCYTKAQEHLTKKERQSSTSCFQSLEILNSSMQAMEFLCRSWSPSASDILQTFSSANLLLPLNDNHSVKEHEERENDIYSFEEHKEKLEAKETEAVAQNNKGSVGRTRLIIERSARFVLLQRTSPDNNWMNLKPIKEWLRGKSLTSIMRRHREKIKGKARLHTANVHSALSVARLAAAIAGFAANSSMETVKDMTNGGVVAWDKNMSDVVAYATAFLATVCAEAAESVGAHKAHVASAVNSGLAAQTPVEMMALTATAATCLRGAETLKSRAVADACFPTNQELHKLEAKLSVVMPSGKKGHRWVSIYSKHRQLMLSLEKKYLGVWTTTKEYKLLQVMEEIKEAQGDHLLRLESDGGDIKLLFEDKKQLYLWMSNISNLITDAQLMQRQIVTDV